MTSLHNNLPLISVIIPAFNSAAFLSKAINSVLLQTYRNYEIIVMDDGSTDNTRSVVREMQVVKYYYQENKGLSAARNNGMLQSNGDYLVFLDADDWLEKDALQANYSVIKERPDVAFVSGNYYLLRAETNSIQKVTACITSNHYAGLLKSNYIGMHAAVLFQRWVFRDIRYDETLRACEDYDLYLTIARKYPIIHHQKFIATYYFHRSGLSHKYQVMMESVTAVIKKQEPHLRSPEERSAYLEGLKQWEGYYQLMKAI